MNQILFQDIISTSTRPICVAVKKWNYTFVNLQFRKKWHKKSRTQNHWQPGSKECNMFFKNESICYFNMFHVVFIWYCIGKKWGGQCPPRPPGFDATDGWMNGKGKNIMESLQACVVVVLYVITTFPETFLEFFLSWEFPSKDPNFLELRKFPYSGNTGMIRPIATDLGQAITWFDKITKALTSKANTAAYSSRKYASYASWWRTDNGRQIKWPPMNGSRVENMHRSVDGWSHVKDHLKGYHLVYNLCSYLL